MLKVNFIGELSEIQLQKLPSLMKAIKEFDKEAEFHFIHEKQIENMNIIQKSQQERENRAMELMREKKNYVEIRGILIDEFGIGMSDKTLRKLKANVEEQDREKKMQNPSNPNLYQCQKCHNPIFGGRKQKRITENGISKIVYYHEQCK